MKPTKTVYYSDELNDDFAGTDISTKKVDGHLKYVNHNPVWNFFAFLLYYLIASPIVWLVAKVRFGLKIKNRKNLRLARKTGYFIYANHTQAVDSVTPAIVAYPKKAYLIADPDAVSIKGLKNVVLMLGAIPVPDTLGGMKLFMSTVEKRIRQKRVVAIYPEAHIWPYYTGIRPFPSTSFRYPLKLNVPSFAMVTTYRERKSHRTPGMTLTISEPFYPNKNLGFKEAQEDLRDRIYAYMKSLATDPKNVEYIHYEYRAKKG